jgi:anti-sigma factor RsiW
MNCTEFLLRYSDLRDGLVTAPRERRRFERHLARCPACRQYDEIFREGLHALHAAETIQPSPGFRARLEAKLAEERRGITGPVLPRRAGLAAALCVMAAVALFAMQGAGITRHRAATPELPAVIFPKPVAQLGVPLVAFHDPRASVLGGNPNPYGTALVQPASVPLLPPIGR